MTDTLTADPMTAAERRVMTAMYYQSGWDRAASWLWRTHDHEVDDDDNVIVGAVKPNGLRDKLAVWCSVKDWQWREKYVGMNTFPPDRWKR